MATGDLSNFYAGDLSKRAICLNGRSVQEASALLLAPFLYQMTVGQIIALLYILFISRLRFSPLITRGYQLVMSLKKHTAQFHI